METDEHGSAVVRPDVGEVVFREVSGSGRKGFVFILVGLNDEVDGIGSMIRLVICVKHFSAVVDLGPVFLDSSPHGLDVAIEQEGVQLARGSGSLADIQQVSCSAIFLLESEW